MTEEQENTLKRLVQSHSTALFVRGCEGKKTATWKAIKEFVEGLTEKAKEDFQRYLCWDEACKNEI